jgi:hypothetical protein
MDLLEACARQWLLSVQRALNAMNRIPQDRLLTVHYEDFVRNPKDHLKIIASFIGVDPAFYVRDVNLDGVSLMNIGNGCKRLSTRQRELLQLHIGDLLETLHYDPRCK